MYRNLALLAERRGPRVGALFLQSRAVLLHDDRTIVGLVVEKANGRGVDKRVSDPSFHCVRYALALVSDTLGALDAAQRELGLVHYDLKLDNVIEHWGPGRHHAGVYVGSHTQGARGSCGVCACEQHACVWGPLPGPAAAPAKLAPPPSKTPPRPGAAAPPPSNTPQTTRPWPCQTPRPCRPRCTRRRFRRPGLPGGGRAPA
ncbi:MAG: hypothetical protein J3K34DRAFT_27482 [Monoraphidium minutum]|nr:MAG: hypothetical protein J3K34DRAFT_27482 [Monoraphidium minutum]